MAHHLLNLLFEAASAVPRSLGSTWIGLFFPLWVFVVTEIVSILVYGWKSMSAWIKNIATGTVVALVAWGVLFICCVVGTVYRDHTSLVSAAQRFKGRAQNQKATDESAFAPIQNGLQGQL